MIFLSKNLMSQVVVVVQTFNTSTRVAKGGGSLWVQVQGQPGLQNGYTEKRKQQQQQKPKTTTTKTWLGEEKKGFVLFFETWSHVALDSFVLKKTKQQQNSYNCNPRSWDLPLLQRHTCRWNASAHKMKIK